MSREPQYGRRRKSEALAEDAKGDIAVSRGMRYFPYVTGAVAFLIYLRTMTPGMQTGDGTELATAAHVLGIPHPTGYPLYMLLAKAWLVLTIAGDVIMRTTILNALLMSAAVGLTGLIFADLIRIIWKTPAEKAVLIWAGAGALTLAFLRFHWGNAVVTEVYALQFLLMVGFTRVVQRADGIGGVIGRKTLVAASVLLALALAHHRLSITLLLPYAALWYIAWYQHSRPGSETGQVRRLPYIACLLILLCGASIYAYLPIRAAADPPVNWGNPDSVSRFYNHVRGTEYLDRGLLKPAMGQEFSASSFGLFFRLQSQHLMSDMATQFAPFPERLEPMPGGQKIYVKTSGFVMLLGLALAVLAVWGLSKIWAAGSPVVAAFVAGIAVQNLAILYVYNIADIRDYFLYPFWAAWIGLFAIAAWGARKATGERRLRAGYAVLVLLPMVVLAGNWQRNDRSGDIEAEIISAMILPDTTDAVPPGSILITDDDTETFTTWYRQKVRGDRTDVFNFAGNFVYMPWYETFFSEQERREYQVKLADGVARSAQEYAQQLRDGIIDANIMSRPVFTSINDPAVLAVLAETYDVVPVDSVAGVNRMFDEPIMVVLYRISVKGQA